MSQSRSSKSLSWWANHAYYLLFGMSGMTFLLLFLSPSLSKKILDRSVTLKPDETLTVGEITAHPQTIGAIQINVEAFLPSQRWAGYEVQLLDQNDQLILAGFKDAWHESGKWYEEGESGTWYEDDAAAGFDFQVKQAEKIKIVIAMTDISDQTGKEVPESLTFRVKASQGTIDVFPLWLSGISTALLGFLQYRMR